MHADISDGYDELVLDKQRKTAQLNGSRLAATVRRSSSPRSPSHLISQCPDGLRLEPSLTGPLFRVDDAISYRPP